MRAVWILGWAVGLLSCGCSEYTPGRIESGHFQSKRFPLAVAGNGAPESAGLMPTGWKLENYYGTPPTVPKITDAYRTDYELDADGDGNFETKGNDFIYQLRFTNLHDDGVVWLRVLPVPNDLAERQLTVLVESYVQSLSGGNYESFKVEANRSVARDKRFAATLVSSQACHIADAECQLATVDIADVDQLKISPTARTRRIQVVLARTRFEYDLVYSKFPGFLMVGYSNQPASFDSGLHDYQELLNRITIRGKTGLQVDAITPAPPTPAPTTPPIPSAPPAAPASNAPAP